MGTLMTVVQAVNTPGNYIPLFLIFPRINFPSHFIRDGPVVCEGDANPSGCTVEKKSIILLNTLSPMYDALLNTPAFFC